MKLIVQIALVCMLSFVSLHAQNVGVGTDNPQEFFSVGASSQFRVNASGNLVRINNVQYSFPAAQATSGSVLANDGSGNLSWTKVTTGNISATGTASNTTFLRGDGAWQTPAGGGGATLLYTNLITGSVANTISPAAVNYVQVFSSNANVSGFFDITINIVASAPTLSGDHYYTVVRLSIGGSIVAGTGNYNSGGEDDDGPGYMSLTFKGYVIAGQAIRIDMSTVGNASSTLQIVSPSRVTVTQL